MGNMKYVKLFESWLATNDSRYIWEAEEVDRFSTENPEDWPISETTIPNLYSGTGGVLNLDVLGSMIGRVNAAKTGGTWSDEIKNSVITLEKGSVTYKGGVKASEEVAEKIHGLYGEGVCGANAIGGKFKSGDIFCKEAESAADFIKNIYAMIKNAPGLLPTGTEQKKVMSLSTVYDPYKGDKSLDSTPTYKRPYNQEGIISNYFSKNLVAIKAQDDTDGKKYGIIILKSKNSSNETEGLAVDLPALVISAKGNLFGTTLGAYLLYLATGKSKDMEDSQSDSAIASMQEDLFNKILAGETKGSVNYASTDINGIPFDPSSGKPGAYSITSAATTYLGQLEFAFNKSELNEKATGTLSSKKLQADMTNPKYKSIVIAGYADGMGGKSQRNDTLSSERAENVLEFIKKMPWFSKVKAKVSFEGRSISNPIIPDNGGKDKLAASYNRRVEIIFDGAKPNYDKIKASYEKVKASGGSKK